MQVCGSNNVAEYEVDTPIGCIHVTCCAVGLHSLSLSHNDPPTSHDRAEEMRVVLRNAESSTNKPVHWTVAWLEAYFCHPDTVHSVVSPPLCIRDQHKDSFRVNLWQQLMRSVQLGETTSYGELARLCGNARAARAVGQALRINPFMLIVPCHRVITSSGHVGNYAGGTKNWAKHWLLKHERT